MNRTELYNNDLVLNDTENRTKQNGAVKTVLNGTTLKGT